MLISEGFLAANLKDNAEIYLLGDFNIDYSDRKSAAFKELDFTTRWLGLVQLVTSPTRTYFRGGISHSSKIDLIFSNSEVVKTVKIMDINLSDHLAVMVTHKKVKQKTPKIRFSGRSYKNYDKDQYQESLLAADWTEFFR